MDVALLRDSLGLRADSERLAGAAQVYMEVWNDALALGVSDSPFFESNRPHTFKCSERGLGVETSLDKMDEGRRSDRCAIHFVEAKLSKKASRSNSCSACCGSLWRVICHEGAMQLAT